jgi:ABC-type dipeptide/oligopeptide/nickel transport system permease component
VNRVLSALRKKDLELMGVVIGLTWLIGMVVTVCVGRARIGMSQWGIVPLETVIRSLPWFVTSMVVIAFWPVALVIWLVRGRPSTPWELTTTRDNTLIVKRRR